MSELSCGTRFGYWLWITYNMSGIYGLLLVHIWDMTTDAAVILKLWNKGEKRDWKSRPIAIEGLIAASICAILAYRIVSSVLVYRLTHSIGRFWLQMLDLEIYRTVWISFRLKLAEPGYIQTWLQKLEVRALHYVIP